MDFGVSANKEQHGAIVLVAVPLIPIELERDFFLMEKH